jgi:multidrug efflux system membrane fusion protein
MQPNRLGLALIGFLAAGPALAPPVMAQAAAPADKPGVPVSVTKPVRQDVPVYLRGLGTIAPTKNVLVRSRVDGTLDSVAFTEGDEVKQGAVLAVIDPRPYQAVLDQVVAKRAFDIANLANARLDLARYNQLARNQFAAQQQVDTQTATVAQIEATIKGDEAAIAAARLNLDFTRITAPFDGRVGLRQLDPGNFVHATDATGIVTLSQIKPVAVTFTVPQDNLPAIAAAMARGKPAVIASSANGLNKLDDGELLTIDNAIDPATGTIKIKATFPNAESKLWPGQFVNASLLLDVRHGVLTVPTASVQHGPNGLFVFVVKADSTVIATTIEVVQDTGTLSVISKGLTGDETVVLNGQSRLANGMHVVPTATPAAS